MQKFRVFMGAPSADDLRQSTGPYTWQKVLSEPVDSQRGSLIFPPATLEAASRRISLIYQNVIFDRTDEEEEQDYLDGDAPDDMKPDQTTMITWPPTPAKDMPSHIDQTAPTFLHPSISHLQSMYETQETQETASYNYSDASSIARFPSFQFSLHSVTPLSSLLALSKSGKGSRKVNVVLAALEVEGPDTIRIKKGADAGKEVSILKMILGDEDGSVCKLTAWREVADSWGGGDASPGVKRGDVVFIENVTAAWDPSTSPTLTASPYLKPKLEICYRTMPYTHEDNKLRPDLRLGITDAAVRKVAAVVAWFESMAGLRA